jgi:hypothetical protein
MCLSNERETQETNYLDSKKEKSFGREKKVLSTKAKQVISAKFFASFIKQLYFVHIVVSAIKSCNLFKSP